MDANRKSVILQVSGNDDENQVFSDKVGTLLNSGVEETQDFLSQILDNSDNIDITSICNDGVHSKGGSFLVAKRKLGDEVIGISYEEFLDILDLSINISPVDDVDVDHPLFAQNEIQGMYTIKFQKRGLPHAYIVLWLDRRPKLQSTEIIDELICVELPNSTRYQKLYVVRFTEQTSFDEEDYPIYRSRDLGVTYEAYGVQIDNRFVVPYNPFLLMKYRAHINLDFCNKSNVIKYLFKYVNKGLDHVTAIVSNVHVGNQNTRALDDIKEYFDCRYLSPCEFVWRIFSYDIYHRWPSIQRLTFHLPNQQHIIFDDRDIISSILVRKKNLVTMFIAWMLANMVYPEGKCLTYVEFPRHFVYVVHNREWKPRQRGFSISRLSFVPPTAGELFYMRLLLNVQRGCTSFKSIRIVNGTTYDTFQEACFALGFLTDDNEFVEAIKEAALLGTGLQLKQLFVTLLLSASISRPLSI
ncbi:uncharacterized protein LOC130980749 [Arachis stenosperma]|uniref:uncharacterized protein LOC130980749 n=1 Tax=Arachis stenosperma TaxID=217475 RepID=UPI0025AC3801|nr:uncharacterized protein LOC130980749 [Arachis stenosperma]